VGTAKPRLASTAFGFAACTTSTQRSRAAAKCNSLVAGFEGDLGGRENLTTAQAQLVQGAAFLAVMCEDGGHHRGPRRTSRGGR
jgi:hypothetical protein